VSWDALQIEYSLLKRGPEVSGLLRKCKELGVTPVAHSPLAQGLLTDFALEREDAKAKAIKPLLQLLQFIGAVSGGKAIEQVLAVENSLPHQPTLAHCVQCHRKWV
jgi:aryl-alcohol dehydrogenase-like predicted oxidoreductase